MLEKVAKTFEVYTHNELSTSLSGSVVVVVVVFFELNAKLQLERQQKMASSMSE